MTSLLNSAGFEKEYLLAKTAGCEFSDTLLALAFRLLEATNLSEMDEKFVLTGIDYEDAKVKKNLQSIILNMSQKVPGKTNCVWRGKGVVRSGTCYPSHPSTHL